MVLRFLVSRIYFFTKFAALSIFSKQAFIKIEKAKVASFCGNIPTRKYTFEENIWLNWILFLIRKLWKMQKIYPLFYSVNFTSCP